jgi:hypothetical protein
MGIKATFGHTVRIEKNNQCKVTWSNFCPRTVLNFFHGINYYKKNLGKLPVQCKGLEERGERKVLG